MKVWKAFCLLIAAWVTLSASTPLAAQESVCARVKIEIKQDLTLERQAFDAEMRITNSLPATSLTEVSVQVNVTDELGAPISVTTDPNNLSAKFFIRLSSKQNISDVSGTGEVTAQSTATINWLMIPAPGAAGTTPFGKKYLVGATLRYRFGTETHVMELNPDVITVKPLPMLTLDYFLTRDVIADDPFTQAIEAPEPYTLGLRIKNTGIAAAKDLKIQSAQPRIVDNGQGLPITFRILGSYVQDVPATSSLLINFGDIAPSTSKMGRWQMESNIQGTFVDFTASFTHSDELGGALTSLLQATNAHLLVHDVRVDLPGRDVVRDFLAADGTALKIYESDSADSDVIDRSAETVLTASTNAAGQAVYRAQLPASSGFIFVRKADPFLGQKALGPVMRADAKLMGVENVWLSKTVEKRRSDEAELLRIGHEFRAALASYRDGAGNQEFPASLDELLEDKRTLPPRRHLRKVYFDPVTRTREWGLEVEAGRIVGIHSLSERGPLKVAGFDAADAGFENAEHYSAWIFRPAPPSEPSQP